ncbi:MAG TPA: hypothetical protein VNO33_02165 [Kofleriaceae bacterium]|nr:hypothetical protein [Kofleriaceae bacterium]
MGGGESAPSELERSYPVLRWVPAEASYALVAARASEAALAARELAELVSIAYGVTTEEIDAGLRSAIGASPLQADDLARAGIDLRGSAAVFGQAGYPTAVLPVADRDRLRSFLDRRRGARVTRHGDHEVHSWPSGDWSLSLTELDRWLVVRFGPRRGDVAWLDQVLAAGDGATLGPALAESASRGRGALGSGERPGLIGLVRLDLLGRDLAAWPDVPEGLAGCARRAARAVPRILMAADFSSQGGASWTAIDLAPRAAGALRVGVVDPPPPGYRAYRDGAAISLDWSVELGTLERARAALACPLLDDPIEDPVRAATGFAGPRGWHVAATEVDLDDLSGAGAAHLVLADPALIQAQLESIPARSWFERTRRIAGQRVKVLSVPGLPTVTYRLGDGEFTVAVGDGVMEEVLSAGKRAASPELAQLTIRPPRLPELDQLIGAGLVMLVGPHARPAARAIAERLSRYDEVALSARLDGDSVAVFARVRLRRTARLDPARVPRTSLW